MASCKDCLHVEVCRECVMGLAAARGVELDATEIEQVLVCDDCDNFKDRSRFVELPCKIGTELFRIKQINGKRFITNTALNSNTFWNIVMQREFGKTVFLSREEAEHALKERESNG